MKLTLPTRLLGREQGEYSPHSTVRSIYGDKAWIDDLDIVNELGGHSGCVNALRYGALAISSHCSFRGERISSPFRPPGILR